MVVFVCRFQIINCEVGDATQNHHTGSHDKDDQ